MSVCAFFPTEELGKKYDRFIPVCSVYVYAYAYIIILHFIYLFEKGTLLALFFCTISSIVVCRRPCSRVHYTPFSRYTVTRCKNVNGRPPPCKDNYVIKKYKYKIQKKKNTSYYTINNNNNVSSIIYIMLIIFDSVLVDGTYMLNGYV